MKKEFWTNQWIVLLIATIACALWGTAFPFIKLSYQALEITPGDSGSQILFAAYRFLLASILLFILLAITKRSLRLKRSHFKPLVWLGLLQTTLQYLFFYIGLANTTGVKASILAASGSFFAVILSHWIYLDDKISWPKIFGLVFGFAGVFVVNVDKESLGLQFAMVGEGLILLSALVSAWGGIYAKKLTEDLSTLAITAYQMLIGSCVLLLMALPQVDLFAFNWDTYTLGLLLWLAFLSAAAFALWYSILKFNPLGKVTIYKFLIPVFGVFFSAMFLAEETITLDIFWGLLLVSIGIIGLHYGNGAKDVSRS